MATNTSYLAGEFLVAGELSRRGYPISITMGNAKSIDIYAETSKGTVAIDVKASKFKTSWPIKKAEPNIYYVFVYLQEAGKLREKNEENDSISPEYYLAKGKEIQENRLIQPWKSMPGIKYATLNTVDYKERWNKLPPPP